MGLALQKLLKSIAGKLKLHNSNCLQKQRRSDELDLSWWSTYVNTVCLDMEEDGYVNNTMIESFLS